MRAESGDALVVELPGRRFVAIQSLDPWTDDEPTNALPKSNPAFRALVEQSKASGRKPFVPAQPK